MFLLIYIIIGWVIGNVIFIGKLRKPLPYLEDRASQFAMSMTIAPIWPFVVQFYLVKFIVETIKNKGELK